MAAAHASETDSDTAPPGYTRQGECALLFDPNPDGALDLVLQQRLWSLADTLKSDAAVREVVLGMNNVLVVWREPVAALGPEAERLDALWRDSTPREGAGRVVEVPVSYGGPEAEDLAHAAEHAGLSPRDYAERHAAGDYVVYALGSQPGFGYLGGLPPELAVPRRRVPRPSVPSGAIMIGGGQAGIQSRTTPSGWHVIGMSTLQCFDARAEPPVLLAPGDRVRFQIKEIRA
ncbi:Allophanate hydrolase 2 subunit 1 [plant metagenome]